MCVKVVGNKDRKTGRSLVRESFAPVYLGAYLGSLHKVSFHTLDCQKLRTNYSKHNYICDSGVIEALTVVLTHFINYHFLNFIRASAG